MREGDCLIVTKLDRLARSVADLCKILAEQRKVSFRVLNMNLDTSTPTGKLIINVLGSIAQFQHELIRERMLVGIAKARVEGKYKGRKPTARAKADKVKQLRASGIAGRLSRARLARRRQAWPQDHWRRASLAAQRAGRNEG
jgi:DNA invertase Pin-like site-specific DNA recombinase